MSIVELSQQLSSTNSSPLCLDIKENMKVEKFEQKSKKKFYGFVLKIVFFFII